MKFWSLIIMLCVIFTVASATCNGNSWQNCVGSTRLFCPCYQIPCLREPETVHKRITQELVDIIVERRYNDAANIFDEFITINVSYFGITVSGVEAAVAYLFLGDPDISDQYEVLNATIVSDAQERRHLFTKVRQYFRVLTTNVVYTYDAIWELKFNKERRITEWNIYIDSLQVQVQQGVNLDLNITSVCTNIQNDCSGTNQQFATVQDCITFMSGIPLAPQNPAQIFSGNTVVCRSFHELLARSLPDLHCLHVGTQNLGPFATPCNDF